MKKKNNKTIKRLSKFISSYMATYFSYSITGPKPYLLSFLSAVGGGRFSRLINR